MRREIPGYQVISTGRRESRASTSYPHRRREAAPAVPVIRLVVDVRAKSLPLCCAPKVGKYGSPGNHQRWPVVGKQLRAKAERGQYQQQPSGDIASTGLFVLPALGRQGFAADSLTAPSTSECAGQQWPHRYRKESPIRKRGRDHQDTHHNGVVSLNNGLVAE